MTGTERLPYLPSYCEFKTDFVLQSTSTCAVQAWLHIIMRLYALVSRYNNGQVVNDNVRVNLVEQKQLDEARPTVPAS